MKNLHLRLHSARKQHQLTQSDVAYLLCFSNPSSISRFELGERLPGIELILAYHILFRKKLEFFFSDWIESVSDNLAAQIDPLISTIEREPITDKTTERIRFLKETLQRLRLPETI